MERKYLKWVLGLERLLTEENKCEEISNMTVKRALSYEEKSRKSDKKLVMECIKEIEREMIEEKKNKWKTHIRRID